MPHPATEPHFLLPFHQILLCLYLVIEVIFPDDTAVLACVDRAEFYLFQRVLPPAQKLSSRTSIISQDV
jgi:hypothetical protein